VGERMTMGVGREVREVIRDDILQGQQQRGTLMAHIREGYVTHARVSEAPSRVRSEWHGTASGWGVHGCYEQYLETEHASLRPPL